MKSINPSCKFIGLFVLTFFLALWHDPVVNIIIFVISILCMIISKVRIKTIFYTFLPILLAAVGMFVSGWKFSNIDSLPINAERLHIGSSALWNGLTLSSRVLVYAGLGLLFAFTTNQIQMVLSFQKQLHLPALFSYGILAAFGIFPHIVMEYKKTKASLEARGKKVFPVSPALLKPLLVKSVRWSEQLSQAMESKGFDGYEKRSMWNPPTVKIKDHIFLFVTCIGIPVCYYLIQFSEF